MKRVGQKRELHMMFGLEHRAKKNKGANVNEGGCSDISDWLNTELWGSQLNKLEKGK